MMNEPDEIRPYQYLWDGSQPGWVLQRLYGNHVEVALRFDAKGPSNREIAAVRRTVSEYKSMPLAEVISRLRGRPSLALGRFESLEARRLAAACRKDGLDVMEEAVEAPRFILVNEVTSMTLIIEDDVLAEQVIASALRHGLPVRHVES